MTLHTRCFFIGHRDTPLAFYPVLLSAVQSLAQAHPHTEFFVGNYGNFDHMAARAVLQLKTGCPTLRLTQLLAYHPTAATPPLPPGFDGSFYPDGMERVPKRLAIVKANEKMLAAATHLIAHVTHPASNAQNLLQKALRRQAQGLLCVVQI